MQIQRKPRPKFAHWRLDHQLTTRQTAAALNEIAGRKMVSHEKVRTICLPFDDAERTDVDAELADAIFALTRGEVRAEHFQRPPANWAA